MFVQNYICQQCGKTFSEFKSSYVCDECEGKWVSEEKPTKQSQLTPAEEAGKVIEDFFNELNGYEEECSCGDCQCGHPPETEDDRWVVTLGKGQTVEEIFEELEKDPRFQELAREAVSKVSAPITVPKDWESQTLVPEKKTLVVNFFPGPGAGKSTVAAGVYNKLKWAGIRTELASEFAKDLVWEGNKETFKDQIYMFGEMYHRIFRLLGKVDVIVTDSPILLTPIYDEEQRESLKALAVDEHHKMWTYNVYLIRTKPYDPVGRNQTEADALKKDKQIREFLEDYNVPTESFLAYEGVEEEIVERILNLISR